MEPEFDNEIDALLRREAGGRSTIAGEFGGIHMDADEITAFAENRLPPRVRGLFMEHLAACDRCRNILLNTAWLNSEEKVDEEANVVVAAAPALPWYRRLFLFPNLAYVMGGLVVLFAGFIGLSLLTTFYPAGSEISQSNTANRVAPPPPATASNTNASVMNAAVPTANTAANATSSASETEPLVGEDPNWNEEQQEKAPASRPQPGATGLPDRAEREARDASPPPPPEPQRQQNAIESAANPAGAARPAQARPVAASPADAAKERNRTEDLAAAETTRAMPRPEAKMKAANAASVPRGAEADRALRSAPGTASGSATNQRQIGPRKFELRYGVWYDSNYRGQPTTVVNKNSEEFRRLDSGLRSLAASFSGVVVTVWNGRAYRIQ
jgi:hypothetical protein